MPGKEGLKPTERPSKCLGVDCEYVSYKDKWGRLILWCSRVNETVYDIQNCPFEHWFKDDKGRIIKKGSRP